MFDDELNAYATEIVQGMLDAAARRAPSSTSPCGAVGVRRPPVAWARELVATGREAVIGVVNSLTAGHVTALARAGLPLVVIDPIDLPRARVTSVGATNFAGGVAAARHLLSLGHRRVAYVGGSPTAACSQARMRGFRAAMEAADLPVPTATSGRAVPLPGRRRRDGRAVRPPVAAHGRVRRVRRGRGRAWSRRPARTGCGVPEDLSVVGFDDTQLARYGSPPLTTVRQPLREMGAVALRTALRMAAGEELDSHHVELATELIVRKSTAAPATA